MKKVLALILALVLVFSLAACGGGGKGVKDSSNSKSSNSSGSKLSSMSESDKENAVLLAAVEQVERELKNYYSFDSDETRVKRGTIKCNNSTDKREEWSVSGTLYLYDNYGSLTESATFTCDKVYLDSSGSATNFGHYEVDVDGKTYHN